jgi:hypothetical protein
MLVIDKLLLHLQQLFNHFLLIAHVIALHTRRGFLKTFH